MEYHHHQSIFTINSPLMQSNRDHYSKYNDQYNQTQHVIGYCYSESDTQCHMFTAVFWCLWLLHLLFYGLGLFQCSCCLCLCLCIQNCFSCWSVCLCIYVHVLRWVARCLLYCLQCVSSALQATGKPLLRYAVLYA